MYMIHRDCFNKENEKYMELIWKILLHEEVSANYCPSKEQIISQRYKVDSNTKILKNHIN